MIGCICPHCNEEVEFDPSQAGYMIPCPECAEFIRVPGRLAARSKARIQFRHVARKRVSRLDFLGIGGGEEPADAQPKIRCSCPHCLRVLHVPSGAADEVRICPACAGRFFIPPDFPIFAVQSVAFDCPAVKDEAVQTGGRKRRRRPRDYNDAFDRARRAEEDFERGRLIALVVTLSILLLTVIDIIGLMATGTSLFRRTHPTQVETTVLVLVFLGLGLVLRFICLFEFSTSQNWARIMLGIVLMPSGLCGIFTTLRGGGVFGVIQLVLNLGFGVVLLSSPSLAAYTKG